MAINSLLLCVTKSSAGRQHVSGLHDEKDVYGTVDQQLLLVKIYIQFWDLREEMLDNLKQQKNADQSDS